MTRRWLTAMFAVTLSCRGVVSGENAADAGLLPEDSGVMMMSGDAGATSADAGTPNAAWPTWRKGLSRWQWVEIPGSSLSKLRVTDPFSTDLVAPDGRIDAWNGLAANSEKGELYLACAGGHGDWAGNEAYAIDLTIEAPVWRLLRASTHAPDIVQFANYYADGRPSSTHLYYALHFVRAHHRVFKLSAGSTWGSGNESNSFVDAFDLTTNDWDAIGTWDAGTPHQGAINRPYAHDAVSDDLYTFFAGQFRKWQASNGTWHTLAARPSYANDDIVNASPSAVDHTRKHVLFTRNAYRVDQHEGLMLDLSATPSLSAVTLTGAVAEKAMQGQAGLWYLAAQDGFFAKTVTGGEVVRIDPVSLEVSVVATSGPTPPDAVNGVFTRWQYLSTLKGFAYLPRGNSNFWFIATD